MNESCHIVCPHCQSINRVQHGDLGRAPDCGRCHQPLALDEAAFERHLSRSEVPLLVDFWAAWCGPCRQMAPAFAQAAARLEPGVRLAKIDTEAVPSLSARLGIRSIPTLILFRQGREIARQAGAMGSADIVAWTASALR